MMSDIPQTMKAVVVRESGDASVLRFETDYPTPDPKNLPVDHVLVKNEFAGINFIDTYHRKGLYPRVLPFVAGQEGGGRIVQIAPSSSKHSFQIGDRVAYSVFGSYAEYTVVPICKLVSVPDDMDMKVAITSMVQGQTAHYLATSAHANLIQKGEWCLIYSVGSGTCQWAAQIASKIMGFRVIGTCSKGKEHIARSNASCEELIVLEEEKTTKEDGSHVSLSYADYQSVDIAAKVMEITNGKGVKCIMDGVGKSTADISLNCLAQRGIFISFGNASGTVPPFSLLKLVAKSAFVTRPKLNDYVSTQEALEHRSSQILDWIQKKQLHISIDQVFPLRDAIQGHIYLESGKSKGKLLFKLE